MVEGGPPSSPVSPGSVSSGSVSSGSVNGTMTAAFVEALGPPEAIRIGPLPLPTAGPTDLLVEVDLVAANPVDTLVRSGEYPTPKPFPFVVGRDLVGRVVGAGPATGFDLGEMVWCNSLGHEGRQGSFATYAVVPAARAYRLPAGVEPATAVAVAHPAATAYLGLFAHGRLTPCDTVYVGGGGGNVGSAALTMARRAGARAVCSARPEDADACRAAGAEVVLDYRDPELASRLREAAPDGVDLFWDTSGHHDFDLVARVAAPGARVLLSAQAGGGRPALPVRDVYTHDLSLIGFVVSRASVAQLASAARLIDDMLVRRELSPKGSEVLPLAAVADVHRRLEQGRVNGRVLLRP